MKKKIYMYFHAGSKNHGCEAIVRTTAQFISSKITLISDQSQEDKQYGIDKIVDIEQKYSTHFSFFEKVICFFCEQFLHKYEYGYKYISKHESKQFNKESIALSIGGDNYCYGEGYNKHLEYLNMNFKKRNMKTVLWGCSVNPDSITETMKKDFSKYDLITARETISYKCLKQYNSNTVLVPDTAFFLEKGNNGLPDFFNKKVVGINMSPLIQKKENIENITTENYITLIQYLIDNTNYNIALIPHVVWDSNDDKIPLKFLYNYFHNPERLMVVEDCNCMELKNYISHCSIFVGARTHATIAAYSTCVPTLVVGYSTKAKGIARDLFGSEEHYVVAVQSLHEKNDLLNHFLWIEQNQDKIACHLKNILPKYKQRIKNGVDALNRLLEDN